MDYSLSKITVIIPTRDRQDAVYRQIAFWGGTQTQILILDNGKNPLGNQAVSKLPENITYVYKSGAFAQLLESLDNLIRTPYAIYCDDDNLVLPSGLAQGVELLEKEDELLFVWGKTALFQRVLGRIYLREEYIKDSYNFAIQNNPTDRVSGHLQNYQPTAWYAIHRRAYFLEWTNFVARCFRELSTGYATEWGTEIASFYRGKSRCTDQLTVLRSLENPPLDQHAQRRTLGFAAWLNSCDFQNETKLFFAAVMDLCQISNINVQCDESASAKLFAYFPSLRDAVVTPVRFSLHTKAEKLPFGLGKNALTTQLLRRGSQLRGKVSWWAKTVARGQAGAVLLIMRHPSTKVFLEKTWSPSTRYVKKELDAIPW